MSKASEWFDTIYPSCPSVATIQAIIDDARAGMVPEAELAKAWESGWIACREAAASMRKAPGDERSLGTRIRALQPPGGKPK